MLKTHLYVGITLALFAGWSCESPTDKGSKGDQPAITRGIAVITAPTDYSAANIEIIDLDSDNIYKNPISVPLHNDLAVRTFGSDVYILERYDKNNIIRYDSKAGAVVYQENLGSGININIQDIAVVSETKAYISCEKDKNLIIFNPQTGKKISNIDLSAYSAGQASYPFASSMMVYNNFVYVACQRFTDNGYDSGADPGLIIVVDSYTDIVVAEITLNKKNPMAMDIFDDRLLVASAGHWSEPSSGGIEMIDLTSNQNIKIVAEMDGASGIAYISSDKAYVRKGGFDENCIFNYCTKIFSLDLQTGDVSSHFGYIKDGSGGIVHDGVRVYVGERFPGEAGVVVINPVTNTRERKIVTSTTIMLPVGLGMIFQNW
ncbi:MAG: hypothetical protein LBI42_01780 [Chitinispirillales bacterium]|jgi:outer membrane protein assembly factor BamB|nr:hypothetical protein [Chitinispirillales bacterium]